MSRSGYSNELPKKVIDIESIRINRGMDKICDCKNRRFMLDTQNKKTYCRDCGAEIDPYDAMYELATSTNYLKQEVDKLLEQRKQIINYKPWLLTIRNIEKQYRGKKMLPGCPRCDEPFYLEELKQWYGKEYADARINKYKKQKGEIDNG